MYTYTNLCKNIKTHLWLHQTFTTRQLSFFASHKSLIGDQLESAMLVRTLLFTQIRNKFLLRGNLRALFNCLYDSAASAQTATTYDMENFCHS